MRRILEFGVLRLGVLVLLVAGGSLLQPDTATASSVTLPGTVNVGGSADAFCYSPTGTVLTRGAVTGPQGQWVDIASVVWRLDSDGKLRMAAFDSQRSQLTTISSNGVQLTGASFRHTLEPGRTGKTLIVWVYVRRWNGQSWSAWSHVGRGIHYQYQNSAYKGAFHGCVA